MPETPGFVPTAMDLFAHSVTMQFSEDVDLLGEYCRQLFERVLATLDRNKIPERAPVLPLLLNGLTTAMAALELWRRGLLLQVGILLRNALETFATAAVISSNKAVCENYQLGRYESSKAWTDLKKVWPEMGAPLARATGFLSDEFVHVGASYGTWLGTSPTLSDRDIDNLKVMLLPIKATFHFVDALSEWVCWETVGQPRYWERIGPRAYAWHINQEGREWMKKLFKEDLATATGQ